MKYASEQPSGVVSKCYQRLRRTIEFCKYWRPKGYDARRYWENRHSEYGFDIRGVGNAELTKEENDRMYAQARSVFLELCTEGNVIFPKVRILDVGCGTGSYANILRGKGVIKYTGIDITDVLFNQLRSDYPGYNFIKMDVSSQELTEEYDLIIMIDVTQHITAKNGFSFAMQNIKKHLSSDGVFIVTSWLSAGRRNLWYEVSRTLEDYKKEFGSYNFSKPKAFRDKSIFSIRAKADSQAAL